VWDGEFKGFGVLVLPSGVKSYVYDYRTPQGTKRRTTIGKHGDWKRRARRRTIAATLLSTAAIRLGAKRAEREAATVGAMVDAYLASEAFASLGRTTSRRVDHLGSLAEIFRTYRRLA
jgi:hypothetical protein